MSRLPLIEVDTADEEAKEALKLARELWGADINVARALANSPALLKAFVAFRGGMRRSILSDSDREVIALELSRQNGCHYCIPAHTARARQLGIPDDEIGAIISGASATDPRRRLLQTAARRLLETHGLLSDDELSGFGEAGLTHQELMDVIGEIAVNTVLNFGNRLAQTDLDERLQTVKLPATIV